MHPMQAPLCDNISRWSGDALDGVRLYIGTTTGREQMKLEMDNG